MKIVVLDGYTLNPGDLSWNGLEALGDVVVYDRTESAMISQRIGDASIVLTNKTPITREIMQTSPCLKYIGVLATGYNVVDVKAASEMGVAVTNIPTYGTDAVSQFAIALLLELCHHVGHHSDSVMRGEWANNPDWCYWHHPLMELSGKTMGIIGFGRIGYRTGKIAESLGMNVLAYDEYQNPAFVTDTMKYATLDEVLRESDVISLHCPLLDGTKGMVCKENIAKMKDGVLLINTSRGPLVVEADLADALNSGKVGGAAVDVVSVEPILNDNPLLHARNMLITPHIAWAPRESRERLMHIAVANVERFLDGKPVNVVSL